MNFSDIDKSWTLFLDRDGVINVEVVGDYITKWNNFKFYPGVLDALKGFAEKFGTIVIVTNQRGVTKGLMTEADLLDIHNHMLAAIEQAGGRIDKIYYCTDYESSSPNRKPNTGMGLQAQQDFPHINFEKSLMVGNTMSDMQFGKKLGMHTIFIASNRPAPILPDPYADVVFLSLEQLHKIM